jgi:hypothetical protein
MVSQTSKGHLWPDGCPNDPQASCGLAIVTTVAAVGLSLKQGNAEISSTQSPINRNVQRDRDGHSDLALCG